MRGFTSPNHTQTPNNLFDDMMSDMGEAELKVVLAIVRKTLGYHKTRDPISLTQLQTMTGLSRQGVIDGLENAVKRGIVKKAGTGKRKVSIYELVFSDDQSSQLTKEPATSQDSRPVPVNEVDTQKKLIKRKKDSPAPQNGAGTSPAKQAKANPLYDAVEAVWGYTAARNGAYGKMLTGVATGKYKPCNVEPGMTPDEIREWAEWWKSHNQGLTMLAAPDKVQSSIYEWRKRKANPAPKVTEMYERPTQEEIDAATSVYGALKFDENGKFIGVTSEQDANPVWTPSHLR